MLTKNQLKRDHTASRVAQMAKNLPAMRETWVQSLGWEDLLEKGRVTHSSILSWRIPWTAQSVGLQRVDMAEQLSRHFTSLNSSIFRKRNLWDQGLDKAFFH